MPIDAGEVRRIAALARLELDDRAVEPMRREMGDVLAGVGTLSELDSPVAGAARPEVARLRSDVPAPSETADRERALGLAPDRAGGFFRVPRILGE